MPKGFNNEQTKIPTEGGWCDYDFIVFNGVQYANINTNYGINTNFNINTDAAPNQHT